MSTEHQTSVHPSDALNAAAKLPPNIIIEDYKGFAIRKCRKGYLAFQGGRNLDTCSTVEEATASVDAYFVQEREREEWAREMAEAQARREREAAERARLKTEAVLACIQPIRDFVEGHGLNMLRDCLEQLAQEERERNVPANWEELVEICEKIAEWRLERAEAYSESWENHLDSEPDVTKYGVTEQITYTRDDHPTYTEEYTLQGYIDEFKEDYLEYQEDEEGEQ